jgi:hypothetical protein
MAVLALYAVGAALGNAAVGAGLLASTYLGVATASLAGSAAAAIGSAALAPTQKSSGPRLADLKATQVAYGTVIPYVEGHPRVPGIIIYASRKREISTTTEEGGKGGGGVEVTQFTYEQDLMYLLSANEVKGLRRIWWNGELVWSAADESDDDTLIQSQSTDKWTRMTFYSGAADQLPDPTYEAAVETANAPAYRTRSSIFFEGMQLGQGGVLPNLNFEIVQDPGDLDFYATKKLDNFAPTAFLTSCPPGGATLDDEGVVRLPAILDNEGLGGVDVYTGDGTPINGDGIESTTVFPGSAGGTRTPGQGGGDRPFMVFGNSYGEVPSFRVVGDDVVFTVTMPSFEYHGEADMRWATWDGLLAIGSAASLGTGLNEPVGNLGALGNIFLFDLSGTHIATIAHGAAVFSMACTPDALYVLSGSTVSQYELTGYTLDDSFAAPAGSGRRIFTTQQEGLACANAAAEIYLWTEGAWDLLTTMVADDASDLGTASCIHMVDGETSYAIGLNSVSTVESYYRYTWTFRIGTTIPPAYRFRTFWEAVRDACGSVWDNPSYTTQPGPAVRPTRNRAFEVAVHNPANVYPATTDPVAKLHVTMDRLTGPADGNPPNTWETVQATVVSGAAWLAKEVYTDKVTYYHQVWTQLPFLRVPLVEPTLQEVVERQCVRGGMDLADIDASELATEIVWSMPVSQITSPRATIENLMFAYHFYAVESDKVYFHFRGGSSVATIPYTSLVVDGEAEPLPIVKGNDTEIAVQVFVTFFNLDDDHQNGSEQSDRLVSEGQNTTSVELPLGLHVDRAKKIADAHVTDGAASILRFGPFSLTRAYAYLEPGDVVTLTDAQGNTFRARLTTKKEESGRLTFEAVSDNAGAFESAALTSSEGYTNSVTVARPVDTDFELLDMPILRDEDDNAGFYVAVKPHTDVTFPGAAILGSRDGTTYTNAATADAESVFGVATTTLATGPWGLIDEVNTLTVDVGYGELSSITRDELLETTKNAMLVGSEVIQFRTATLTDPGIYTLSGLLRGQRGTEWAIANHVADERVVLLGTNLRRVLLGAADIGQAGYWKAVTLGRSTSTGVPETFTDNAVGLKPYAPINLRRSFEGGRNVFTWDRRTRLDTNWLAGVVPLGEETEEFYVELLGVADEVIASDTVEASGSVDWAPTASESTLGQSYAVSGWGRVTVGGSAYGIKDTIAPNFNDIRTVVRYTAEGLVAAESPSIGRQVYGSLVNGTDFYTCSADISSNTVPAYYLDGKIRRFALPDLTAPAATYTAATEGDPQGIAFDGTDIWIAEFYSGNLRRLNVSTLASIATYVLNTGIAALTYDSGFLWICSRGAAGSQVIKWNAVTHAEALRFSTVAYPTDVLVTGGKVYVQGESQLGVYNATTGALVATHQAGNASQLPQRNMVLYGTDVAVIDNTNPHAGVIRIINGSTGALSESFASPYWYTNALNGGATLSISGFPTQGSAAPVSNQLGTSIPDADGALVRVYQLSATVGRGYPAELVL